METVHLIGAEEVTRAARSMNEAADKMHQASVNISASVDRLHALIGELSDTLHDDRQQRST